MYPDQYYHKTDTEIADATFDELFEDQQLESDYPDATDDNIFSDDAPVDSVENLVEDLTYEIQGMDPEQAYEYISEAWPALIPLITAIAPSVIQAATQLAPIAVKAVGGLVGGVAGRGRTRRQPAPRPPAGTQPARRVQVQPPAVCNCQPQTASPGALSRFGQGALNTLANLLGNKNIQGILSGLATKGVSQALKLGNSEALAREGALLNAIEYLARQAQAETLDHQFNDSLDYLIGPDGEFVTDVDSADSKAERFIELYES